MCTVSIFLDKKGLTLTANRDERRIRGESGLRQDHQNEIKCIYPVDAKAKGTWVGVNSHGLAAALLNMYEGTYQGSESRGFIIPKLLTYKSLTKIEEYLAESFDPSLYSCFTLIVANTSSVYRYSWDGNILKKELLASLDNSPTWLLETSSSVNLDITVQYRKNLFKIWQEDVGDVNEILSFHLKQDIDGASKSICMARELSHTKSLSQIQLNSSNGRFSYLAPEILESLVNTHPLNLDAFETIEF